MSTVLDERSRRQARSRAVAAAILDAPRVVRRFVAVDTGLRSSARQRHTRPTGSVEPARRNQPQPEGDGGRRRRLAGAVLILQLSVLAIALFLPTFRVTSVKVSGTSLLTAGAVQRASGLSGSQSVFTVDGDAVRNKLLSLGWVRSATVETELPNVVRIVVQEWPPIMALRTHGQDLLVSANGASVPLTATRSGAANGLPLLVDDRADAGPEHDAAIAGGVLARMLAVTAQRYPAIFGCTVASFQWASDGNFAINAATGWRAILGHLDSAAAIDAVPAQLAALAALKGPLDFVHPKFGYVDLENPATPAVGGAPSAPVAVPPSAAGSAPQTVTPAKPAAPAASSAAPAATAVPTAVPTPTPQPVHTFVLPPPPAH